MSIDHSRSIDIKKRPAFLNVVPGDVVIVWEHPELVDSDSSAWWMGEVISAEGSARNTQAPSRFQIADVDSGVIRWVNAVCVQRVVVPIRSTFGKVTTLF